MADPAEIFALAAQAFDRRQWPVALQHATELLKQVPQHPVLCYIGGIASMELNQMPQALDLLYSATKADPTRADFATQYARALAQQRLTREARLAADRALALQPNDPMTLDTLGVVYTQTHEHHLAAQAFGKAVELVPNHAPFRFNLATALIAAGDIDGAEQQLEVCIGIDVRHWKAHMTLAQLRRQTPEKNHIPRLEALLAQHGDEVEAQTCLNMALAKEYEDTAEYSRAFGHFVRCKSAGTQERGYSYRDDEALFEALQAAVPAVPDQGAGYDTDEPIFVIGMPRSGTTLIERIISSHPDVFSAGELQNFAMAYKFATRGETSQLLDIPTIGLTPRIDWRELGETYLSSTRPATGHKPHFIDKLPHNFLYAGFIAQALPRAKIICLRRDPIDTCLSNFRQLFSPLAPYYGYSFDLLDTGRYYVLFDRLMAHWRKVLPGRILEVQYESLVDAQEEHSRRLIEFCGLPWNDACLSFEKNPAPVNTASAVQVRAPVYRSALKRWKKYEPDLGDLMALLESNGIAIDR